MAEEELELDVIQSSGSKTTTILLIALIVLVLIMGGVGAWVYLSKEDNTLAESETKTEKVLAPLHYLSLVPEFVVNFGPESKVRFLQVDLQIATRDENALNTINTYRPVLRNEILVLLSGLSFEQLKERSGKEELQKKILDSINKVVNEAMHSSDKSDEDNSKEKSEASSHNNKSEHIEGPIENVYFTSFIMQ